MTACPRRSAAPTTCLRTHFQRRKIMFSGSTVLDRRRCYGIPCSLPHKRCRPYCLIGCNAVILPKFALRDDGAVALSQAIKGNPSLRLEALNLFYTGMQEVGVEAIAKAIGSGTQHALLTLLLGDNQVGDGVFALATAVKRLPSLIVLDLSRANIGDAAMWEGGATSVRHMLTTRPRHVQQAMGAPPSSSRRSASLARG